MYNVFVHPPLPGSHEKKTVTAAVQTLTPAKYTQTGAGERKRGRNAKTAYISVEDADIRWTIDGTSPSDAIGHVLPLGSSITIEGFDAIKAFKAYAITVDAEISVTYFGD